MTGQKELNNLRTLNRPALWLASYSVICSNSLMTTQGDIGRIRRWQYEHQPRVMEHRARFKLKHPDYWRNHDRRGDPAYKAAQRQRAREARARKLGVIPPVDIFS